MILPLNLNRRHKVTLFLTVLLAGIAALNGAKMMQVVGILLLGLALAWAFGSDSRVVHWLFLSVGALLACGTVGLAWLIHQSDTNLYAQKVAAFEQRIPELAKEYPLHKVRPSGMDRPSREWDEQGNPVQTNGQIILDKDLEPYLVKPKAGMSSPQVIWDEPAGRQPVTPPPQVQIDPATGERTSPQTKGSKPLTLEQEGQTATPIAPVDPWTMYQAPAPATLPADFFSHLPGGLFQLTMPDGHVRYFKFERDANNCQQDFFARGKTQKMWNEAWVAGLDLSEVDDLKLPGDPPKTPWEHDDWWASLGLGVFLFALGLGLILGIRAKPLPT